MQTIAKTTDTNSRCPDHGAGVHGISAMPPVHDIAAPIQKMGEGEASAGNAQTEIASADTSNSNLTGLPDKMKTNLENASGFDMSDIRVHRNNPEPAKVGAFAYTQGTDIYLGPGQEQHLGHEAWHSAQYKQGRVQANTSFKSADGGAVAGNDQVHLEKEADVMGAKLMQPQTERAETLPASGATAVTTVQRMPVIQRDAIEQTTADEDLNYDGKSERTGIGMYLLNQDRTLYKGPSVVSGSFGTLTRERVVTVLEQPSRISRMRRSYAKVSAKVDGVQREGYINVVDDDLERVDSLMAHMIPNQGTGEEGIIMPQDPAVEDVKQGMFGSCFLLSALMGLTRRRPGYVKRAGGLFVENPQLPQQNITVRFFRPQAGSHSYNFQQAERGDFTEDRVTSGILCFQLQDSLLTGITRLSGKGWQSVRMAGSPGRRLLKKLITSGLRSRL